MTRPSTYQPYGSEEFQHHRQQQSGSDYPIGTAVDTLVSDEYAFDELKTLIDPRHEPVFITGEYSESVIIANTAATEGLKGRETYGRPLRQFLVHRERIDDGQTLVYFNRRWMIMIEESFHLYDHSFRKTVLQEIPGLPHKDLVDSARDMIAVMLHRFRSPMTGMQGYLDLLLDGASSGQEKRRMEALNSGLEELNNMLDDMENFYHSDSGSDAHPQYVQSVIQEILDDMDPEYRDKIRVGKFEKDRPVKAPRNKFKKMIHVLIKNALEHPSSQNSETEIELVKMESTRKVNITNYGDPIPDFLKNRMFYPFMTNKARNLGIGLTLAHLIARQIGATLYLSENSREKGITFSILMPPENMDVT